MPDATGTPATNGENRWPLGVIVAICATAAFIALTASITVVLATSHDPDAFYRFLSGQFLGNLGTFVVLILGVVMKFRLDTVTQKVKAVERNTNGTTSTLLARNQELAEQNRDLHVQINTPTEGQS